MVAVVAIVVMKRRSRVSAKPRTIPRKSTVRGDTFDAGVVYESGPKTVQSPRIESHKEDEDVFEI